MDSETEDGRNQQLNWKCSRFLHLFLHSPMTVVIPKVIGNRALSHNHCPSHQFSFKVYHGYYYLVSSVGVSAPPPRILPHSPGQKFANLCSTLDFYSILSGSPRADSTIMQKHLPLLPFFCIPFWSFRRVLRSRRTDDLRYPDPHIARF